MSRTALVLGAGIAGLSAAIALRDAGYAVEVHEQAERIEPLGAALGLWPNAVAALRRLGALEPIGAAAAPISAMLLATQRGRPIMGPWPVDPARHGEPAYLVTRALLQTTLAAVLGDGVPVRLGRRAVAVEDRGDAVTVQFADSDTAEAALVIAADGIWSATGTALAGNAPTQCGYGGVLALSDAVGGPPLDGLAAEYWGAGERFGVFDLGEGRRYWFFMQREPALVPDRNALLRRAEGWPAAVAAAIAATPAARLIPVSIAARGLPRRLAHGHVIGVGDAVHAMEPNLGQGACMALEDAVVLGALAARLPPEQVAAAYDRVRRGRIVGMMRRAREGGLAVHGPSAVQRLARGALRLVPAAVHRRMIDGFYRLPA